jgi:hypothetical protein
LASREVVADLLAEVAADPDVDLSTGSALATPGWSAGLTGTGLTGTRLTQTESPQTGPTQAALIDPEGTEQ